MGRSNHPPLHFLKRHGLGVRHCGCLLIMIASLKNVIQLSLFQWRWWVYFPFLLHFLLIKARGQLSQNHGLGYFFLVLDVALLVWDSSIYIYMIYSLLLVSFIRFIVSRNMSSICTPWATQRNRVLPRHVVPRLPHCIRANFRI